MARLGALRERNFRRLFAGQAVSSFGDALVPVALAFAVLRRTGSATDLGLVLAAEMFSQQVSYLLGGVLADRWSRRVVMVAADAGRAAGELILGGLLVAGHPALWVFCALAALQGAGGGLFGPAASGLVPAVVSDQHVQQANQLQSMARGVASVAGPAAGGLLLLTVGAGWALLADGVSFAVSLVTLLGLGLHLPPRERISSPLQDLRSGWAAFSSRRWYVVTVAFIAAFNLFGGAWLTLGPVIVRRSLGGAGGWAAISSVGALGAVVGGFGMLRVRPRHPFRFGARLAAF
ncbi:MAG: MFS transporter [Actinomycetota bacterium]|nr:MFS transporter [Actinomycetota bacterium]